MQLPVTREQARAEEKILLLLDHHGMMHVEVKQPVHARRLCITSDYSELKCELPLWLSAF